MKKILLLLTFIFTIFFSGLSQCTANAGDDVTICFGQTSTLGGTSTGNGALTYSWSPTIGLSCNDCPSPTATPSATTTYTLTIEDGDGCISTDNVQIIVNTLPDASFAFLPNNVCANTPISFSANSNIGGNSYVWNYGNPASSSNTAFSPNTIHEFVSYGTTTQDFNVTLTVTDANGCQAQQAEQITINSLPQAELMDPLADFRNCDGTNFNMTVYDMTPFPGNNYQIIWGDGSSDFNGTTPPTGGATHLYTSADIFDLYYIVTGTNGCVDTAHYVVSNITNPAIGAANPGATTGCGPITLCFPLSNYSTNHPSTYYIINYGDNSPVDTIQHANLPSEICHTYTTSSCGSPGNAFTFTIQAENPCDISIASINPIRVYTAPQPAFTAPQRACVNTGVTFTNNSITGFNASCQSTTLYQWNFGDGVTTAFSPVFSHPAHTYTTPGTYTVTLTVQNACGTHSISHTICIEVPPVPDFSLNPSTGCVPFTSLVSNNSNLTDICQYTFNWQMTNYTTTCPATQNWNYVNGTNASSWEPQISFGSAGNYVLRLAMTNTCGTFYQSNTVQAQDVPQIVLPAVGPICEGESISPTVTVNDCYSPTTGYQWNFPSGTPNSSTNAVPGAIIYPNAGNFTVSVQVTNACGTVNASRPLVVNAPPLANAGPDVSYCSGQSSSIGSTSTPGVTYQWNPTTNLSTSNQSLVTATPSNGGNTPTNHAYVLTASTSPTCFSRDTVVVTVNPIPVPSTINPAICIGENIELEVTTPTSTMDFVWNPHPDLSCTNCPNPTVAPTSTTTYSVTATNEFNCSATTQSTVTVNPLPVVNAGPDQTVCDQPISFNLTGTPVGGTWSGNPNVTAGGIFTPNGAEIAEIIYSYTHPTTGCENTDTLIITVEPPAILTFQPTPEVCINAGLINLNNAFEQNPMGGTWSGTGVAGINFNPSSAGIGTHSLTYTYGNGTCLIDSIVEIIVNLEPTIVSTNETICVGESVILSVSGAGFGGTYSWNPTIALSCNDCENPSANPTATTTYTITGTNVFGCSSTTTSTITVNPLPVVNAGPDQSICNQPIPVQLNGTPAGGTWSGSPNVSSTGEFIANGEEIVELTYTFLNSTTGCQNSDVLQITVSNPIVPTIMPFDNLCINASPVNLVPFLDANPTGGSFTGNGVSGSTFNPSTAGIGAHQIVYFYGSGTCLTSDTSLITVNPFPDLTTTGAVICFGETAPISISSSDVTTAFSWTPIASLSCNDCPNPDATPTSTTTYTIVGTNAFGCSNTTTETVTVNPLPVVNAGTDQTLCDQPIPVQLTGIPAGGTWSGSPNLSITGEFIPNSSETVDVVYSYTNPSTGCTNTDTVNIIVSPPVIPTFNPDIEICINNGVVNLNTIFAPNPLGGSWSGTGVAGATFNPITTGTGNHILTYTYGTGTCQTINPVDITVNPEPVMVSSNATICFGESTALTVSGAGTGGSYTWTPSTGLSCNDCDNPTANPTSTTNYTIIGTNTFGCSSSTISTVTVNPLPLVNTGNDTTICNQPIGVQFNGTIAGGTWTGAGITTTGFFTPSTVGTFNLTYTVIISATGCQNSDDKIVTVVEPAIADAGIDQEICIDNSTVLVTGIPTGGTWSGTNIDAGGIFSIATAGTFELVYTNGAGNCLTRDTMEFIVHALPIVNAGSDFEICISEPILTLSGTPSGGTFSGTGITDAITGVFDPEIAGAGTFIITYTYTDPVTNCVNSDNLNAIVRPLPVVNFTADPIVCMNVNVPFTNTSTLVNQVNWDFGDGNTSLVVNPTHVYTNSGIFDVQLIVTTQYGCIDSITHPIEVYVPPVVDFDVTPDSLCGPLTASFQNNSVGPDLSFLWNFGNGTTSTSPNPPSVIYPAGVLADTSYTITLTVTNYCGQLSTQETVIVMPQPVAVFGTDFNEFCSPWSPNIANTSYGLPDYYYWDFGNGTTSTTDDDLFQLPVFTADPDTTSYTIMLVANNECGTDTAYHTITVLPNTVNSFFNTSTTAGCVPLTVDFTQYTLGGTNYHWNFGDGNVSSTYSPSHTFTQAGTFNVSLIVDNSCSFDTTVVAITVHPSPVIVFSHEPDSVCTFTQFQFINESEPLASYLWNFGDGNSSNLTNPTHAYATPGTYTVTLSGTSIDGSCSSSTTEQITVSNPPNGAFTINSQAGCVPLNVQFVNQSTGYAYSYWEFGDGNTSVATHPQHTYTTPGTYTVLLIVQGVNGCSDTIAQYVNVNPIPTADFSYQPTGTICGPDIEAQFTNLSTGAVGYQWNFGDGGTSTLVNPSYDYLTAGTFTIQLIVSNQFGCTDTATQQITIHQTPEANFTLPSLLGCEDALILFNSNSVYTDSIVWNFGNGASLTGNSVLYEYPDVGSYVVSITAYGSGGCTDTYTATTPIDIQSSPEADFSYETSNTTIVNATVIFTNQSNDYTSSFWDFGNGDSSTENHPTYDYNEHNDFYVTLIVYNNNGCSDTASAWVHNPLLQDLYVPNAVYPGHGSYEVSHFLPKGIGLKEYHIQIYDDWGNLIWESTMLDNLGRPVEGWNATYKGVPVQQDAYVWKVTAVFLDESVWEGKEYPKGVIKRAGTVTVIR